MMGDAGLSPAQRRAGDAWLAGREIQSRGMSPGEVARARAVESERKRVAAAGWVARELPDLNGCSFAVASALAVRRLHPDVNGAELVAAVRAWRAGWMQRVGAVDDGGQVAA